MPGMTTPCWEWTGNRTKKGYGVMRRGGRGSPQERATHIAWEIQTGRPFPVSLLACHHCDNPGCVRIEPSGAGHIFPGTNDDNMADMVAKGRQSRGEKHARPTIPDERVREVRALRGTGLTIREVAERLGMRDSTVSMISAGHRRALVP